jgi:hypothetical protein
VVRKNEERKKRNATAKERSSGRVQVGGGILVGTLVDDGAVHEGNRATAGLEGERISVASIHARAHAEHELLTCEVESREWVSVCFVSMERICGRKVTDDRLERIGALFPAG